MNTSCLEFGDLATYQVLRSALKGESTSEWEGECTKHLKELNHWCPWCITCRSYPSVPPSPMEYRSLSAHAHPIHSLNLSHGDVQKSNAETMKRWLWVVAKLLSMSTALAGLENPMRLCIFAQAWLLRLLILWDACVQTTNGNKPSPNVWGSAAAVAARGLHRTIP